MVINGKSNILFAAFLGLLQGIVLFLLVSVRDDIREIRSQIQTKAELSDQKKIEVQLGQFGDRILTLELAVKVIERK